MWSKDREDEKTADRPMLYRQRQKMITLLFRGEDRGRGWGASLWGRQKIIVYSRKRSYFYEGPQKRSSIRVREAGGRGQNHPGLGLIQLDGAPFEIVQG